jgi:RHS repeat-associated protein
MEMPGRTFVLGALKYRFGFQGQEGDTEINGNGITWSYKHRFHDPRIGRFLSIDPISSDYPYYSPYVFSGNRVIDAVEIEGLQPSRVAKTGDCEACKDINVGDGDVVSDIQHNTYQVVKSGVSKESFDKFRNTFAHDPGSVTNNFLATYVLVDRDGSDGASVNDHIDINISGPDNGTVRIKSVTSTEIMVHANFITLEGHPDAGEINFYGIYDSESATFSFTITNITQTNVVGSALGGSLVARFAQEEQWEAVLKNVNNMVSGKLEEMKRTIVEYDFDSDKPKNKGDMESWNHEDLMDEIDDDE